MLEQTILFVNDAIAPRDSERARIQPFSVANSDTFRRRNLAMVAVVASDGAIGKNGDLLWHLPGDLRHFKEVTQGGAVIMGRKTWESLPRRPLPGRHNIVISRSHQYQAEGASVVSSVEEAIDMAKDARAFIIGGGEIYRQALPLASTLYLTEVEATDSGADTFFPDFDKAEWRVKESVTPDNLPEGTPRYRFVTYENINWR